MKTEIDQDVSFGARDSAPETVRRLDAELRRRFGPQGWWPVTIRPGMPPQYRPSRAGLPVNARERLEIIVGAILTQNTAWTNVERALVNLTARGFTLESLAEAGPWLEEEIRPSGYFRQKADRLRRTARAILDAGGLSSLGRMETPRLREVLLSWHGIGPETADSILCYAFARPVFVVDAYTKRLFAERGLPCEHYGEIQSLVHEALRGSTADYGELHARIVRWGKERGKAKGNG